MSEKPLTVAEVRAQLAQALPDYMVPAYIVRLEELPLTPTGKIDRKALPAPAYEHMQSDSEFVPPRTETEKALAQIWTELLNVEQIGIYDDFFDLGNSSLVGVWAVVTHSRRVRRIGYFYPRRYLRIPRFSAWLRRWPRSRVQVICLSGTSPVSVVFRY